jgi:head-tail adaptor
MKPPKASELNTILYVERKTDEPKNHDHLERMDEWVRIAVLQARVKDVSGAERFVTSSQQSLVRYEIFARYRRGIMPTDRLRDADTGAIYNVETVKDFVNRRTWTLITAVQKNGPS